MEKLIELNRETDTATFNYRTNPKPFAEQSTIVQETIIVIAAKESKDMYSATKRAEGCRCRNCYRNLSETKEWYK